MSKPQSDLSYSAYLHPRYWLLWFGLLCIWLIAILPLRVQHAFGKSVGSLGYHLMRSRREICEVNIGLCFPDLSEKGQRALVKRCFQSNGIGFTEAASSWFRKPESFRNITRVHGLENIQNALAKGHGVLLLGGHFSTLDLAGALVTLFIEADVMQRDHNNPLFNAVMTRARQRYYGVTLGRKDIRGLLRRLKQNRVVWYAPDQDYGRKNSVFAPFFNHPAATITSTARIASASKAAVIPFSHFRRANKPGYDIYFHPALENYPSGDDLQDASRTNLALEQEIRRHPEQYLWMHRRFKSMEDEHAPNPYQLAKQARKEGRQRP